MKRCFVHWPLLPNGLPVLITEVYKRLIYRVVERDFDSAVRVSQTTYNCVIWVLRLDVAHVQNQLVELAQSHLFAELPALEFPNQNHLSTESLEDRVGNATDAESRQLHTSLRFPKIGTEDFVRRFPNSESGVNLALSRFFFQGEDNDKDHYARCYVHHHPSNPDIFAAMRMTTAITM